MPKYIVHRVDVDGLTVTLTDVTDSVIVNEIDNTPSVLPSRAEGKWLFRRMTDDYHIIGQCSLCKELRRIGNYCPNCGARMKGSRR